MKKHLLFFIIFIGFVVHSHAQLKGVYTINPAAVASATNYKSIKAAVDSLLSQGNTDTVIFKLADGTYTDSIRIDSAAKIPYNFLKYPVVFTSQSGDSSKVIISCKKTQAVHLRYVKNIYFKRMSFTSQDTAVAYISNADSIHFEHCYFSGDTNQTTLISFRDFRKIKGYDLVVDGCRLENARIGVRAYFDNEGYDDYDTNKTQIFGNITIKNSVIDTSLFTQECFLCGLTASL